MTNQHNPYVEIAGEIEHLVYRMNGNEWPTGAASESAERRLTTEDKDQLRKASLLAELAAEYLHRIELPQ